LVRELNTNEGKKLEYSLAWQIPIGGLELFSAYVDALTGKTITITQNFVT
ncbi:hypothetical protein HY837_02965, partial [archaeon]|nr:hypothetical protein [archaeon]